MLYVILWTHYLLFLDLILNNCLKVLRGLKYRGDPILLEYSQLLRFSDTHFTHRITTRNYCLSLHCLILSFLFLPYRLWCS